MLGSRLFARLISNLIMLQQKKRRPLPELACQYNPNLRQKSLQDAFNRAVRDGHVWVIWWLQTLQDLKPS